MIRILVFISLISLLAGCSDKTEIPAIIPLPSEMVLKNGTFKVGEQTRIVIAPGDAEARFMAEGLALRIKASFGLDLDIEAHTGAAPRNSISLLQDPSLNSDLGLEGYRMEINSSRMVIRAAAAPGLFYGVQTLYQLLPPQAYGNKVSERSGGLEIPCLEITDKPRFSWRGMHLDVSRHFFPKEFIKRYIDLIAMHKMNIFHWHLTDDNGWRIEIDKYPLLTEVSAWRVDRSGQSWTKREPAREGEPATYGGFYTKEDIREIVEYARRRFVTIVPEIEMPGHTSEVFAAYPEYSCSGKKIPVQPGSYWPNSDIFCAGKEETFVFIQDVLDEVMELFPGPYIHVGGDEADKTKWAQCPRCQARMRENGLRSEEELQSYFMKRIGSYITGKGKKLIGWDEILEGGLPPDAIVMSWRGFEGGIEAARLGHPVIMCPTTHSYFDYYQADPAYQPEAIGGLITLKKVYSFHPAPSELNERTARLILGGQGNLWTEYVETPEHAEYMVLPRMTALAEVLWTPEELREWYGFRNRLQTQFARFEKMGVNYFAGSGRVNVIPVPDPENGQYAVRLETEAFGTDIYYTLDNREPGLNGFQYKDPVIINQSLTLKSLALKNGQKLERYSTQIITLHDGIHQPVDYRIPYSERYPGGGDRALVDGLKGSLNYNDGLWQGFNGTNMDLVIRYDSVITLKSINASFLLDQERWIFLPDQVNFYFSDDGNSFKRIASGSHKIDQQQLVPMTNDFRITLSRPIQARYVRVEAVNMGTCPEWHPGKGGRAWIFADEIVIN